MVVILKETSGIKVEVTIKKEMTQHFMTNEDRHQESLIFPFHCLLVCCCWCCCSRLWAYLNRKRLLNPFYPRTTKQGRIQREMWTTERETHRAQLLNPQSSASEFNSFLWRTIPTGEFQYGRWVASKPLDGQNIANTIQGSYTSLVRLMLGHVAMWPWSTNHQRAGSESQRGAGSADLSC